MHLCEDIANETNLAILLSDKLSAQLKPYLESNTVPKGKDLSLLKAVLYRQRLKWIEKETRYSVERLQFEECLTKNYGNGKIAYLFEDKNNDRRNEG